MVKWSGCSWRYRGLLFQISILRMKEDGLNFEGKPMHETTLERDLSVTSWWLHNQNKSALVTGTVTHCCTQSPLASTNQRSPYLQQPIRRWWCARIESMWIRWAATLPKPKFSSTRPGPPSSSDKEPRWGIFDSVTLCHSSASLLLNSRWVQVTSRNCLLHKSD